MAPKEKAIQLVKQYHPIVNGGEQSDWVLRKAKECALIAVDEIIESNMDFDNDDNIWCENGRYRNATIYWGKVKQEIEKL